jgi:putative ABC transport system substrate-binding protein
MRLCTTPQRTRVSEHMRAALGNTWPAEAFGDHWLRRQTRRVLLARLTQVGLLAVGSGLATACDLLPGQARRVPRVGYVANLGRPGDPEISGWTQALIAGLGDYGYIPGQNLQLESRFPAVDSQNAEMISDLLRSGVDVLVTGGTAATTTANQTTSTVPIVGISVSHPVESGLVQSLARPGGNVTAISNAGFDTSKWVELLLKIKPTVRRVGMLYNPENSGHVTLWGLFSTSAAASGVTAVPAEMRAIADVDAAFQTLVSSGTDAIIDSGGLGGEAEARIAALALSHHLVSLGGIDSYPVAGGLMSFSLDYTHMFRRGAYYVDRILKGAKPADLPVELPTTFDLVINQATAKALGVTIPDEVAQQVTTWI